MVFVAQHRHSRVLCYATANVLRDDRDAMAVRFTDYWKEQTGAYPEELLFDGGRSAAADDPKDVEEFFKLGYRGARFSLGYGACPDLEDRAKIVGLLKPERIGVELSEEFQLHPEQSTDAIVVHHPEAKYFNT